MEQKFIDLGDGWQIQEVPARYFLFRYGASILRENGQRVVLPTRQDAIALVEELKQGSEREPPFAR